MPCVIFTEPWGDNSWKVQYDGRYTNEREKHVEVGAENMGKHKAGDIYELENLHEHNGAFMWDLVGVMSGSHKAHFTVAHGPQRGEMLEYKWQWGKGGKGKGGKGKGGKGKGGKGGKGASFAAECHARDARAAAAGGKGKALFCYVLNGDE
jgi:hypothetical protein